MRRTAGLKDGLRYRGAPGSYVGCRENRPVCARHCYKCPPGPRPPPESLQFIGTLASLWHRRA